MDWHISDRRPWWQSLSRRSLQRDLWAGLTGAVIVLPQGVAFALLAGLPPEYGLYTAIVPVIIAALFGSSHHLMSGPTTPISVVVFTTVSVLAPPETPAYISLVLTLTFMVGAFQLAMGMARLGMLVNFISQAVIIGFTAGAALLIITSQTRHLLGLELSRDLSFWSSWQAVGQQLTDTHLNSLIVGLATLACALIIQRLRPRWPSLFMAMTFGAVIAAMLGGADAGIRLLGELPRELPPITAPDFTLTTFAQLASGAFAIALLGLLEAVSIARSIAAFSHQRHNANREFIGQGLSNLVGSFFSSFASSGSFSRSGINYRAGAATPLAAVFSALLVLLIVIFAAPLAAYLPIPGVAMVLILVAYRLVDWSQIRTIFRANPSDAAVLTTTFTATLFVELTFAVYVGVILSLILHLNRISRPSIVGMVPRDTTLGRRFEEAPPKHECPQLSIVRVDGSLFFGASNYVERGLRDLDHVKPGQNRVLILGDGINFIDVTGSELLVREAKRRRARGGDLYLCDLKPGVVDVLTKGGYFKQLGRDHVFDTKEQAVAAIYQQLDRERCAECKVRLFKECPKDAPDEDPAS